jgi:hypothetical protein
MKCDIVTLGLVGLGLLVAPGAHAAPPAPAPAKPAAAPAKPPAAPAKPPAAPAKPTLSPPPGPPKAGDRDYEQVEYKFYVPTGDANFTSAHEAELNAMGAQGWRIVTPIYAGGILNSYLMMRVHLNK